MANGVYHLVHTLELDSLVRDIVELVKESSPSAKVKRRRREETCPLLGGESLHTRGHPWVDIQRYTDPCP